MRTSPIRYLTTTVPALGHLVRAMAVAEAALPASQATVNPWEIPGLSERQREICAEVVAGKTNAEIASACGISLHTVRNHLVRLFEMFDVLTRTELAMKVAGGAQPRR